MRAQRLRLGTLRIELCDKLTPQQTPGAQLGDLHEEVHADGPEERQTRGEDVDVEPSGQAGLDVLDAIGQRVRQLQIGCGTGLLDVIAGNRDGVELRHLGAGVRENIGDDPHRRLGRIDVGVADHEFFENVILDGPGKLLRTDTLLLGRHHVQREDRQHRAVHGHRHRHRTQVDTVEQLAHIQDGVDGHPGHAHIALHARMVRVIPAMGRQVERHGQALLARRQVAAVERVGLGGRGETAYWRMVHG